MNRPTTQAEINALLRTDFTSFITRVFYELNPGSEYSHNWHVDLMAAKLNAVRLGQCKRLIINIPPRYMKSICASVALPAFMLGHDPNLRIICVSYGQDLADKLALDCRNITTTDWYQRAFPETRISKHKSAASDFTTTKQGGRFATSVGGVLTGRGAEVIIIDDPLKPDEAFSDVNRQKANDWIENTLYSRLNSKEKGAIVIIMQRLHMDDVTGNVQEKEYWDVVSLPAIAEKNEIFTFDTAFGPEEVTRKVGEALHPERESLETLAKIKQTVGEYNFAGQYQQSPVPAGGGMIKTAWIQYLPFNEFPQQFTSITQSWDTASKVSELADYSVCTTWGIKDKKIYLISVWRKRVDYPDLKRAALQLYQQYKPSKILIEDKSSGTALLQDLKQDGIFQVKAYKPEGDKALRLHQRAIMFESGQIFLPTQAPWLNDYVHELTSFPTCKHDDQVDSTTQALASIRDSLEEPGLIAYYRDLAQKTSRS